MVEEKDEIHLDMRLTFRRVTETVEAHPSGEIVDQWDYLVPVKLSAVSLTGHAEPHELRDASERIAETDEWFEALANGTLQLIAYQNTRNFSPLHLH
jgi:hypothetical protein